jgi:uncharacterized membrane protein
MTHAEFVAAYRAGRLQAQVDRAAAARLVSARMMLPLVLLPVMGLGVALALVGYFVAGALVFLAAIAFRFAVRRSAPGFVQQRALQDERFYDDAVASGLLKQGQTLFQA